MENKTASNYNDLPLKAPKLKGILLILFLVLLDQGTKYLAIRYLRGSSGISLIDNVLNLRYRHMPIRISVRCMMRTMRWVEMEWLRK